MAGGGSRTSFPDAPRVRLLVVGDSGVGKTSLVHLMCHGEPLPHPGWTVGANAQVKLFEHASGSAPAGEYFLEFWDVSGSDRYRLSRQVFYSQVHAVLLVYDLTNSKSYYNLRKWLAEIAATEQRRGNVIDAALRSRLITERSKQHAKRRARRMNVGIEGPKGSVARSGRGAEAAAQDARRADATQQQQAWSRRGAAATEAAGAAEVDLEAQTPQVSAAGRASVGELLSSTAKRVADAARACADRVRRNIAIQRRDAGAFGYLRLVPLLLVGTKLDLVPDRVRRGLPVAGRDPDNWEIERVELCAHSTSDSARLHEFFRAVIDLRYGPPRTPSAPPAGAAMRDFALHSPQAPGVWYRSHSGARLPAGSTDVSVEIGADGAGGSAVARPTRVPSATAPAGAAAAGTAADAARAAPVAPDLLNRWQAMQAGGAQWRQGPAVTALPAAQPLGSDSDSSATQ